MSQPLDTGTYRAPRLFVDSALGAGQRIALPREQARYLISVMRRDEGAPVRLFNGADGEWLARLCIEGRGRATLEVERRLRAQPEQADGPWLAFALVKRPALELIVEKATELGAVRMLPVRAARSNRDRVAEDRLQRIAVEAAEQSERLDVPEIAPVASLAALLETWPRDRLLAVGDETGASPPALAKLTALRAAWSQFGLLVGPEGGFAQEELDGLGHMEFVAKVGLGPRVLRAETAALAGLTLCQAALGDLSTARAAPE